MGRTYTSKRDFDDYDRPQKIKGKKKHSRNLPGHGMRVINNMSEDDYEDDELTYEYDDIHDDDTSIIQRK